MLNNGTQHSVKIDDEIDVGEILIALWRGRWTIICCTVVFFVIAVFIALMMPNKYRAEALLAPAGNEGGGGAAALAGQFGGLAGLAGINISGGSSVDKTTLTLEVLKSRKFIADFVRRHELSVPLIAGKSWDPNTGWQIDADLFDVENQIWKLNSSGGKESAPTDWEVVKTFREDVLSVSQDAKSQMISISIELLSPEAAMQWAKWLIDDVNYHMRKRDIVESRKSIDYLTKQLESTPIAEMKQIFYELIEEQTKSIMLAEVRDEYALKVVDPPVVPEEKISPNRSMICILASIIGGIIGAIYVLCLHYYKLNIQCSEYRN